MGGRKVGRCEPPNLICQHLAMQPARQHVGGVSRLRRVATLLAGTLTAATSQRTTEQLTWLMPITILPTLPSKAMSGRRGLLSGAAFFGSCEEFPNDVTTAPRHREVTFCPSRFAFSPRAQRNSRAVGLGGMEREASTGGATSGS